MMLWPLLSQALRAPRQLAVVDDQRRYSYAQLLGGAMFLAEQIDSATERRHVGIMLPTSGLFPITLMGTRSSELMYRSLAMSTRGRSCWATCWRKGRSSATRRTSPIRLPP